MNDENKTKAQLISELEEMRKRITELESGEGYHKPAEFGKEAMRKTFFSQKGDMGDLELADILDVQAIQSLMDSFYELARIPMSIIDLKGKVLVGVGWQDICTKFHRVHPETCKHCIESDTQLSAGLTVGESKLYKCKNNMWDIATPIMVDGKHVGNVFSGQFFFDDEPLDYELFRSQARRYGFPEEEYIAALEAAPKLSRKSLDTGMAFLKDLAQMFSRLSYSNIKLYQSLAERDALMNSLQAAEEKYRGIFENATVGIFRTTPAGSFLDANPAVARMFGYDTPEELMDAVTNVGTQLYVDPEARERWISIVEQEDHAGFEAQMRKKNGNICWVYQSGRAVRNAEGKTIYYEGVCEDITYRKLAEEGMKQYRYRLEELVRRRTSQLEERNRQLTSEITERSKVEKTLGKSENMYRTIFENTGVAIFQVDAEGNFLRVNNTFAEFIGYQREELENMNAIDITHPEYIEQTRDLIAKLINGEIDQFAQEMYYIRKDGVLRWGEMRCTPFRDEQGRLLSAVGAIIDRTEQKKSEEATPTLPRP